MRVAAAALNQVAVELPSDSHTCSIIDQLALQVAQHGLDYEQSVLEQHAHDARSTATHPYSFLYAINSPTNLYYRWRTHSLRTGHTLSRWDTRPFSIIPHGPLWLPPVDGANVREVEELEERAHGREVWKVAAEEGVVGMSSVEVSELQRLLAGVTMERSSILAAMGWCVEHAASAAFIVRSISAALLSSSSSSESCRRVALLYLLSDLLYNSTAPVRNASLFRREAGRPDTLHGVWTAFSPQQQQQQQNHEQHQRRGVGRKEREAVLSVLRAWQSWSLFEDGAIEQWMRSVRGLPLPPAAATSAAAAAAAVAVVPSASAEIAAPAAGTGEVKSVAGSPLH